MHGRKDIRLKNYDYTSDGYYFVTAVTAMRNELFSGKEQMVQNELKATIDKIPGVSLDYFVVMPNHVHVILITKNTKLHVGEVVRRFKAKVSHMLKQNIWQANYYEHVIRTDAALYKIREYIQNNPQALLLKFDEFY